MKYKLLFLQIIAIGFVIISLQGCLLSTSTSVKQEDWITIGPENEGQTGSMICQEAGYSLVVSARRCDGTVFTFPDSFTHANCKPGASTYQECFYFYACSHLEDNPLPGVLWEAIHCKK